MSIYFLASALRNSKKDENCAHVDSELQDGRKKSELYALLQRTGISFTVSKSNIS